MTGSYGKCMFNFLSKCQTLFKRWPHHFTFPPAVCEDHRFICPPTLGVTGLYHFNYSNRCEMVFGCGSRCIALMTNDVYLSCDYLTPASPLVKCLFKSLPVFLLGVFFFFFMFNWKIIALKCCVGFCGTTTRISHK